MLTRLSGAEVGVAGSKDLLDLLPFMMDTCPILKLNEEEAKRFERLSEYKTNLTFSSLPYEDNYFDFVFSLNTFHNLECYDLFDALKEIERVGKNNKYIWGISL